MLQEKLITYFIERGYKQAGNMCLETDDPTIPFINATITPFKDMMSASEDLEDSVQIQDCFRARYDTNYLYYFQMFGIEAEVSSLEHVMSDLVDGISIACDMKKEELYIVVNSEDVELIQAWKSAGYQDDTVFYLSENIDKYHVKWKYGDGYPLSGRGLTISYNNSAIEKCGSDCGPFCNCGKYLPLGNVIIVTNDQTGKQYIDVGFGLEFLRAAKLGGQIYAIPDIANQIQKIQRMGFTREEGEKLYNYFRSIGKLCESGVKLTNKGSGYVLKKIIRIASNYLLINNSDEVYHMIEDIMDIIGVNTEESISLMKEEVRRYVKNIDDGKKSAVKYVKKHKDLPKAELIHNIKDTFGLPDFAIVDLFG